MMLGFKKDQLQRPLKYTWLPRWVSIRSEKDVHGHVAEERPELFDAYNGGTTEIDVLNWLHATVMLLKPERVLETGAADGLGTIALASACRNNGFGKVHSVEIEPRLCEELRLKLAEEKLLDYVEVHCVSSLDFLGETGLVFDIGFYDSMCEIRAKEFAMCLERRSIKQLAIFHDTSSRRCETENRYPSAELHVQYREDLFRLASDSRCSGFFESKLSRGLVLIPIKNTNN